MEIGIIAEVKLVDNQKARKAKAIITLDTSHGELTIMQISVVQQVGKRPWVAFPKISFQDKETGEYQNIDIIAPGLRLKNAISEAVLARYKELIESDVPL